MRKQNVLWKKRIAFLLSVALIGGEIGSNVNIINAAEVPGNTLTAEAEQNTEKEIQKTVPVPKEYISLNETEEVEENVPINGDLKADDGEDIIPIIGKDDWKVEEQETEVTEEDVNSDSEEVAQEMLPSVIPVIGSEEVEVTPVTVDASDVTTPAAITVGDVISRNGYDDTVWEDVTEQFSFTPEEDGYYSLELTQNNGADVQVSVESEGTMLASKSLYTYSDYTGFISCKLEAGKSYIWNVTYYFEEEDYRFTLEFKKNNELQLNEGEISGTAGKISSFQYKIEQSGLVQFSLESEGEYSYYLSAGSAGTYKISKDNPITLFYENTSDAIYNLWKNVEVEDKVTLTIQTVQASDIGKTNVLKTVQASTLKSYNGNGTKVAWASFTPKDSGLYAFETQIEIEDEAVYGRIYEYQEEDSSGYYSYYTGFSNKYGSGIVELIGGHTYYYRISQEYGSESEVEALTAYQVMVTKVESQKVTVGSKITLDKPAQLTFDDESAKFYQLCVTSEDGNSYVVELQNLQSFGGRYWVTNENLNSKIYNSGTGEGTLMITRTQNLATQGSYSVEIKEYDVPEVQENVIQENEETLESGNYIIYQFTPETDGTYNFWGISYTNVRKKAASFAIYQLDNGSFTRIDYRSYSDEFDMPVDLTGGVTYYLVNKSTSSRFIPKPGDLIFCHGQAETASIDLSSSTEGKAEISMYKSAKIQMNLPEAGFYQLTAAGSADSYHINYDDTYTLYKGISKTVYFSESGECTINLSREFPKGSGKDTVTFEIKKNDSMTELKTYTKENPATQEVVLGDSGDVCWYQFTPEETGNYTFVVDGNESETDVYLQFYVKNENEEGSFLSSMERDYTYNDWCNVYRLSSSLQAGMTYYVKATTNENGAIAKLSVLKDTEGSIENLGEAITFNTIYGASVKCNIPEDGLYEISIMAQKDDVLYNSWGGTGTGSWWNHNGTPHYEYTYFSAGIHSIAFNVCGNLIGEDAITVKVSPVKAETVMKDITMDKSEVWVKYTPEESGYYTIGGILEQDVLEEDYTICASVYQKTADKELSSLTEYWNHDNSFEESVYLEKGYEYFIEFYSMTVPTNLTVYAQKNEMIEGTLEEELELTFSKKCNITIDSLTSGFYEIALEGNGNDYSVAFGYGYDGSSTYYRTSDYSFKDKTTQTIYLGCNEIEGRSKQFFVITKAGTPTENSCKVTIKKITPEVQELTLGTTFTKTGTANVECYSFTPAETGYYGFNEVGLTEGVYCIIYGNYLTHWVRGSSYLAAGETYYIYVLNQKDKNYSLTMNKQYYMPVYDYNSYNAFIASGGSIGIKDASDITEEMRVNENYRIREVKDGKYIVCSVENFKNKNDIWFLQCAVNIPIDENATNYLQIEKDMLIYGHSRDEHTYDYHYKYLCDSKGRTLTGSSELESPYMAYAVYAPVYVPVNSITIQGISALAIGDTTKLTAQLDTGINFEPSNSEVTWSSSDSSIVSVDNQGNIKANKAGKAVITCKSQDREGKSGSITIVVSQNAVYASKVVITGATKVNVGSSITLKATIDTAGKGKPTKDGVTWTTSDKTVAKVDKNGKVTGVSAGKVTITATSNDGKAKADYTITVKNVNAKKISLNESKITMKKGTTYKWLEVSFSPKNTTDKSLKWKSSNKKVATVDKKGKIRAKGIGRAVITVTSSNGKKDTVKVIVTKDDLKTKKIKLSAKKTMKVGETLKLKPVFTPINTTNQRVKWTSSNTKVATVNSKGVVTAKKSGKVTITVTTQDGTKKTAKCKITVKKR